MATDVGLTRSDGFYAAITTLLVGELVALWVRVLLKPTSLYLYGVHEHDVLRIHALLHACPLRVWRERDALDRDELTFDPLKGRSPLREEFFTAVDDLLVDHDADSRLYAQEHARGFYAAMIRATPLQAVGAWRKP